MAAIEGWDGSQTSTADYSPATYQQPPAPPPYNPPGNLYQRSRSSKGGTFRPEWERYRRTSSGGYRDEDKDKDKSIADEIGYPTDWKYPNWLLRMAQWRNF